MSTDPYETIARLHEENKILKHELSMKEAARKNDIIAFIAGGVIVFMPLGALVYVLFMR